MAQELTVSINPRDPRDSIFGLAPAKTEPVVAPKPADSQDPSGGVFGLSPAKPEPAVTHKPTDLPARGESLKLPRVQPIKDKDDREPSFSPKLPPPPTMVQTVAGTTWSWVIRGILLVIIVGGLIYYVVNR